MFRGQEKISREVDEYTKDCQRSNITSVRWTSRTMIKMKCLGYINWVGNHHTAVTRKCIVCDTHHCMFFMSYFLNNYALVHCYCACNFKIISITSVYLVLCSVFPFMSVDPNAFVEEGDDGEGYYNGTCLCRRYSIDILVLDCFFVGSTTCRNSKPRCPDSFPIPLVHFLLTSSVCCYLLVVL